jgi:hypothetical protein
MRRPAPGRVTARPDLAPSRPFHPGHPGANLDSRPRDDLARSLRKGRVRPRIRIGCVARSARHAARTPDPACHRANDPVPGRPAPPQAGVRLSMSGASPSGRFCTPWFAANSRPSSPEPPSASAPRFVERELHACLRCGVRLRFRARPLSRLRARPPRRLSCNGRGDSAEERCVAGEPVAVGLLAPREPLVGRGTARCRSRGGLIPWRPR